MKMRYSLRSCILEIILWFDYNSFRLPRPLFTEKERFVFYVNLQSGNEDRHVYNSNFELLGLYIKNKNYIYFIMIASEFIANLTILLSYVLINFAN